MGNATKDLKRLLQLDTIKRLVLKDDTHVAICNFVSRVQWPKRKCTRVDCGDLLSNLDNLLTI